MKEQAEQTERSKTFVPLYAILGYALAVFVPILGVIFGIVAAAKDEWHHAAGIWIVSAICFFGWISILGGGAEPTYYREYAEPLYPEEEFWGRR